MSTFAKITHCSGDYWYGVPSLHKIGEIFEVDSEVECFKIWDAKNNRHVGVVGYRIKFPENKHYDFIDVEDCDILPSPKNRYQILKNCPP